MHKEYNISLIYRFIGLLLFLLTIAFIENVYVLMVLFVGIFLLNKKNNPLLLLMTFITLFFIILKMINNSILVANIMLMFDYIIIFVINTKKEEYIIAKNLILNKKFTYKQLEKVYINDISENNKNNFEKIVVDKQEDSNVLLIENRLKDKDNSDVFNKLVVNYMRFYKNQNDNYKNLGINKATVIYLLIHVIILILAMVI